MSSAADTPDFMPVLIGLAVVLIIISRLVRIARHNAGAGAAAPPGAPRPPLWGPVRRVQKLQQNTAVVRSETELLVSTGENLQARHSLDRLKAELQPQPPPRSRGAPAVPALTVAEIRTVLNALDLAPELRATILELIEATTNEKVRQ